jgi:hypothetical protein
MESLGCCRISKQTSLHDDPDPMGTRIVGTSGMNFVALVSHSLSAISVFVTLRPLIGALANSLLAGLGVVLVVTVSSLHPRHTGWQPTQPAPSPLLPFR